ncbi:hypothetical protein O6H91_01G124800 [Diphasiastrum complanatum]|uniref:Uncharacterized protein n=1 Tax=Diphasiastrum complanatum TaxID=34168 RepID=A0ACC2EVW9_DIPCM|nr:hypothetical protein O6H91_01G124800 [Diphasiastrum complanatum]
MAETSEAFAKMDSPELKEAPLWAENERAWRLDANSFRRPDSVHPPDSRRRALQKCFQGLGMGTGGVAKYYKQQLDVLEGFTEMDTIEDGGSLPGATKEEQEKIAKGERFAIRISNLANLILFVAKVYASIRSRSLAIIASTLDSLLDLLSGFILWFTSVTMRRPNPYLYPIGKRRMQPLGILVFASIMATLGLQILLESVRQLVSKAHNLELTGTKRQWVVGIMISVTIVKLGLMFYCRLFENGIVRAYAKDHLFDVITNAIGLVAAILATLVVWWIDPAGAILLALYTMKSWSSTVLGKR